jgi:hypothetical protein
VNAVDCVYPSTQLNYASNQALLNLAMANVPIANINTITDSSIQVVDEDSDNNAERAFIASLPQVQTDLQHQIVPFLPPCIQQDLRRSFSKMFLNTINSGEFSKMQEFSQKFMIPDCPFFSFHQSLAPEVNVPDLSCYGPRMFSHYLLGKR